jgi:hypothetical protein
MKNLDLDEINGKHVLAFLNENHPNFAPDLKIAVEAWLYIFEGGKCNYNSKGMEALLNDWLKKHPEYSNLTLTPAWRERIATIITPKHRKDGGAKKTPNK